MPWKERTGSTEPPLQTKRMENRYSTGVLVSGLHGTGWTIFWLSLGAQSQVIIARMDLMLTGVVEAVETREREVHAPSIKSHLLGRFKTDAPAIQ